MGSESLPLDKKLDRPDSLVAPLDINIDSRAAGAQVSTKHLPSHKKKLDFQNSPVAPLAVNMSHILSLKFVQLTFVSVALLHFCLFTSLDACQCVHGTWFCEGMNE